MSERPVAEPDRPAEPAADRDGRRSRSEEEQATSPAPQGDAADPRAKHRRQLGGGGGGPYAADNPEPEDAEDE